MSEGSGEARGFSRRALFGAAGIVAGTAAAAGAGGFAVGTRQPLAAAQAYDFWGIHQSGILTPHQDQMHFAAFDITTNSRADVIALLRAWTQAAATLMAGEAPDSDSGEAVDLPASGLTITFGFGPSLFERDGNDRYGLREHRPPALNDLPHFPGDQLDPLKSGGDLCVQACANDPQVAVHATRTLTRLAIGTASVRWSQLGYGRTSSTTRAQHTPRNLMGFKDGTRNLKAEDTDLVDRWLWADASDGQAWMEAGTFLVARRIRIRTEAWDRTAVADQEATVGRTKLTGAPLSGGSEFTDPDFAATGADGAPLIDRDSHVALSHPNANAGVMMLRRGYNFTDGTDSLGRLDAGLFFLAFVRDPRTQFVPMQEKLSRQDAMTTGFLITTGSGVYAIPPGVARGAALGPTGAFVGEALFS